VAGGIAPLGNKVVLEESGDYAVWFSVNPREAACVELKLNCRPVAGGKAVQQGMTILRASAGDELAVCVDGCGSCEPDCGCDAVKASLLVLKLAARHDEREACRCHRHE